MYVHFTPLYWLYVCKNIILLGLSLFILYLNLYNTITKPRITPTTKRNSLIIQTDHSRQLCLYYTLGTDPKATMFQLVVHLSLTTSKPQLYSHVPDQGYLNRSP